MQMIFYAFKKVEIFHSIKYMNVVADNIKYDMENPQDIQLLQNKLFKKKVKLSMKELQVNHALGLLEDLKNAAKNKNKLINMTA